MEDSNGGFKHILCNLANVAIQKGVHRFGVQKMEVALKQVWDSFIPEMEPPQIGPNLNVFFVSVLHLVHDNSSFCLSDP